MSNLTDKLDARMRDQLRSRYRPLPPLVPETLGEPVPEPPAVPRVIPDALMERADRLMERADRLMERADRLMASTVEVREQLERASATLHHVEMLTKVAKAEVDVYAILRAVANAAGIDQHVIRGARRAREISRPRQVVCYLSKVHTPASLPAIGRMLGGKDHTTVMHAVRKIGALREAGDPLVVRLITEAEAALGLSPCGEP